MIETQTIQSPTHPAAARQSAGEGGESEGHGRFAELLEHRLGWLRNARLAALQGLGGPLGRQGLAGLGPFLPGTAGFGALGYPVMSFVPVPVTTIQFNFFGLPPQAEGEGSGELAALLESLDLSEFRLEEGAPLPAAAPRGDEILPALQGAGLEVPRDPEELADKLAEQVAALSRSGDSHLEATVDHAVYGPIGVRVEVKGRNVTLAFSTADGGLREALLAAGDGLSRQLAARGLDLDGLEVHPLDGPAPSTAGPQPAATLYKALAEAAAPLALINGIG